MKFIKIILILLFGNSVLGAAYLSRTKYLSPEIMQTMPDSTYLINIGFGPIGLTIVGALDRAERISWSHGPWRWYDNSYECLSRGLKLTTEEYKSLLPKK